MFWLVCMWKLTPWFPKISPPIPKFRVLSRYTGRMRDLSLKRTVVLKHILLPVPSAVNTRNTSVLSPGSLHSEQQGLTRLMSPSKQSTLVGHRLSAPSSGPNRKWAKHQYPSLSLLPDCGSHVASYFKFLPPWLCLHDWLHPWTASQNTPSFLSCLSWTFLS